jgi:two-component system response regulator MprA
MNEASGSIQVLVVDDDDGVRESLCELLASERYEPVGCKSGEAAWSRLRSGLRPSVMLVDLAMGGMSGRELLGLLRGTEWGQHIPVALLSGWHRPERFGDLADAVLSKGAEGTSIIRAVDRLALHGRSGRIFGIPLPERRPPQRAEAQDQPTPGVVAVAC